MKILSDNDIKFKTIQLLNGIKYMSKGQFEDFKYYICHILEIEKTDHNFDVIREAVDIFMNIEKTLK